MSLVTIIRDEIASHERALTRLRLMEELAVDLDARAEQLPPSPAPDPRPEPSPAEDPQPPTHSSAVLQLLREEGPMTQVELRNRLGIPKGSIGALFGGLQQARQVVRIGARQRSGGGRPSPLWALPDQAPPESDAPPPSLADEPEPGSNGDLHLHLTPTLIGRILELVSHKRLGAAGIARELGMPIERIAPELNDLLDKGDVVYDGQIYEAAP